MRDRPPRDGGDPSFDKEFGAGFEALRGRKGDCPGPDLLARYLGGETSGSQSAGIRRHVALCGTCDLLVERMKAFDREPSPGSGRRVLAWLQAPAVAYALAAALLYPAYLGVFGRRQVPDTRPAVAQPSAPGVEPAKVLDLSPERGARARVSPGESDRFLVLAFMVPVRGGARYSAVIIGEDGKAVAPPRELEDREGAGNFYLVCGKDLFPPGRYTLTVTESGGRTFTFPFSL